MHKVVSAFFLPLSHVIFPGTVKYYAQIRFTSLAEQSLHKAGNLPLITQ